MQKRHNRHSAFIVIIKYENNDCCKVREVPMTIVPQEQEARSVNNKYNMSTSFVAWWNVGGLIHLYIHWSHHKNRER